VGSHSGLDPVPLLFWRIYAHAWNAPAFLSISVQYQSVEEFRAWLKIRFLNQAYDIL